MMKKSFQGLKEKGWVVYLLYTLLFLMVAAAAFSYFYLQEKTFISNVDGYFQYYKALIYYHRYLNGLFTDLFVEHQLAIPQFDLHMGEGSDILSALYYTIGDPIAALVAFVPEEQIYHFYDITIVLRIYLSGMAFLALLRYTRKTSLTAQLAGALVYDFSYWMLLSQSKDIYFLNPTIYFPLVIFGVEKIIKEKKPFVLLLGVFLSAISNFYFFYMIALLTVIYVLIRLPLHYGRRIGEMVKDLGTIALFSVLGTGMAAVTVMPVAYALLSNSRIGLDYGVHQFYPIIYYERMLNVFLSKDDPYWLCMGFVGPCLLSLALSLKQIKKDPLLFSLNVVTTLMICLPVFGKVLNGMSYVSNRWSFAIGLVIAYSFSSKWEEFKDHKLFLISAVFLVFAWAVAFPLSREVRVLVPIVLTLFFLLIDSMEVSVSGFDLKQLVLLGLVVLNILYNADYVYSYRGRQRTSIVIDYDTAESILTDSEAYAMKMNVSDEDFYRYSGSDLRHNVAILNETNTTSYYFSIANPNVSEYRNKLGVNEYLNFMYKQYDDRAALHTLANVRYFITEKGENTLIPYGFIYERSFDHYDLYRNVNALPFGYTYTEVISKGLWDSLNEVEKQEAMQKAIVLDKGKSAIALSSKSMDYTLSLNKDVEEKDDEFLVKKDGAGLDLKFSGLENSEYYLILEDLSFDDGNSYYEDKGTDTFVHVKAGTVSKSAEYHTNDYQFYNGKNDYCIYLGFNEKALDTVSLTFDKAGTYSFSKIEVVCERMNHYAQDLEGLKETCLKDVEFGVNTFSGNIDVKKDGTYLLVSVPYSKGWKAKVDGEDAEVLKANECYMALKLNKGSHSISFEYHTPLLLIGAIVSALSFVLSIAALVVFSRKRKTMKDVVQAIGSETYGNE